MAFDNSGTKAVGAAPLRITPKRFKLPLFLTTVGQAIRRYKTFDLRSLNMQSQHDWLKDKKLQLFQVFARKLKKIFLD